MSEKEHKCYKTEKSHKCYNCKRVLTLKDDPEAVDWLEAGECPSCGAICQPEEGEER